LDKPERRRAAIAADYVGFTIGNRFVVGYGLDANQRYRNLPAIYILR
jgi:hypoxanthine phosphoribosyltransferase